MVPSWAVLPAAGKLIVQSIRHPKTASAVVVTEDGKRRVDVVPLAELSPELKAEAETR